MSRRSPLHPFRHEPPGYAAISELARRRRRATPRGPAAVIAVAGFAAVVVALVFR